MSRPALTAFASVPAYCFQGPLTGTSLPLSSLWTSPPSRPLVLVFLRRLGCALCRVYAQDVEALREELGDNARVVCVSFERFGEGSDKPPVKGGAWAGGGYFDGEMWQVDQASVCAPLFGRKGLASGFGLGALISDKSGKMAQVKERGVTGNLTGDGMQLGGQFVVAADGRVVFDKRQAFFGDDASMDELRAAVAKAGGVAAGGGGA